MLQDSKCYEIKKIRMHFAVSPSKAEITLQFSTILDPESCACVVHIDFFEDTKRQIDNALFVEPPAKPTGASIYAFILIQLIKPNIHSLHCHCSDCEIIIVVGGCSRSFL